MNLYLTAFLVGFVAAIFLYRKVTSLHTAYFKKGGTEVGCLTDPLPVPGECALEEYEARERLLCREVKELRSANERIEAFLEQREHEIDALHAELLQAKDDARREVRYFREQVARGAAKVEQLEEVLEQREAKIRRLEEAARATPVDLWVAQQRSQEVPKVPSAPSEGSTQPSVVEDPATDRFRPTIPVTGSNNAVPPVRPAPADSCPPTQRRPATPASPVSSETATRFDEGQEERKANPMPSSKGEVHDDFIRRVEDKVAMMKLKMARFQADQDSRRL